MRRTRMAGWRDGMSVADVEHLFGSRRHSRLVVGMAVQKVIAEMRAEDLAQDWRGGVSIPFDAGEFFRRLDIEILRIENGLFRVVMNEAGIWSWEKVLEDRRRRLENGEPRPIGWQSA